MNKYVLMLHDQYQSSKEFLAINKTESLEERNAKPMNVNNNEESHILNSR